MSRMVHNNKCTGGNAFDEVDGKTYCLGQTDPYYEDVVFVPNCKKCPRLLKNNEDKIDFEAKWLLQAGYTAYSVIRDDCYDCELPI